MDDAIVPTRKGKYRRVRRKLLRPSVLSASVLRGNPRKPEPVEAQFRDDIFNIAGVLVLISH